MAAAAVCLCWSGGASAQTVTLEFVDGRVNLVAQNAPVRAILAEWARIGGATIVNAERVPGGPVTLELRDVPERQALKVVLSGVAGYMVAERPAAASGASAYDRILILPTSSAPRSAPASTFTPPPPPVVQFQPEPDDAGAPSGFVPGPVVDPDRPPESAEEMRRRVEDELRRRAAADRVSVQPVLPQPVVVDPDRAPLPDAPAAEPATAPAAPAGRSSPFTALPGAGRFGEVAPAPAETGGQRAAPER